MAKIYKIENDLQGLYDAHKKKMQMWYIGCGISFILFLPTMGLTLIPFLACAIFGGLNSKKVKIYESGLRGEAATEQVLASLSDDYHIFPNMKVSFEGKSSEIDHLVVGRNGVFVVETKNVNGHVVGSDEDRNVVIHKVGQKGGKYSKELYNPVKQVGTHVYRVSSYLKQKGFNPWIQGIVYFTNPKTSVDYKVGKTPVFVEMEEGRKDIINYIQEYEPRKPLSDKLVSDIVKLLSTNLASKATDSRSRHNGNMNAFDNTHDNNHNNQMQDDLNRMQQEVTRQQNEWAMDETIKAVTPFDHGGYVQGEGFNPSDTMNQEMHNMNDMNNMNNMNMF